MELDDGVLGPVSRDVPAPVDVSILMNPSERGGHLLGNLLKVTYASLSRRTNHLDNEKKERRGRLQENTSIEPEDFQSQN